MLLDVLLYIKIEIRIKKISYNQVLFTIPGCITLLSGNTIDNTINIDIEEFCYTMIKSVKEWVKIMANNEKYIKNEKNCFKRHNNGIAPYIVGIPVYCVINNC